MSHEALTAQFGLRVEAMAISEAIRPPRQSSPLSWIVEGTRDLFTLFRATGDRELRVRLLDAMDELLRLEGAIA